MFSVVMPAYNAERYIVRAVESILAQTERDFEFFVVDDGSEDGTLELLRPYASGGQIQLIESPHLGGGGAFNLAAQRCGRPWIAVMHADDEALPERLARQRVAIATVPAAVVWGAHAYHINAGGRVLGLSRFGPETVGEYEARYAAGQDINVLHPTAVLRRDVFLKVGGYDPQFSNCEDVELFMRMARHGPVLTLPEPLLRYRLHDQSNTMLRFNRQCEELHFVRARHRAELAGESLTFGDFQRCRAQRTSAARFGEAWINAGWYHWRRAATARGQGQRLRAATSLMLAGLLNPPYVCRKLWRQAVGPVARRLLRPSPTFDHNL